MGFRDCTIEDGFFTTETQSSFQHGGHGDHGEEFEIRKECILLCSVRSVISVVNKSPIPCVPLW